MHYYRATLQYDGTDYAGFQWQKDIPTIQNDINLALGKLRPGKLSTLGASRTDSGVHALDQTVKITTELPLNLNGFLADINSVLNPQLRILTIKECPSDFNPSVSARSKEYRYFFTNFDKGHSQQRFIAHIANPLNLERVQACIEKMKGQHDFQNFCSAGSNVKTTVRTVIECELQLVNPRERLPTHGPFSISHGLTQCYELRIVANGFLKQMIRHLVSALWMVGSGKLTVEEFEQLLAGPKKEQQQWRVAPAKGLFLWRINY
jgi:tRNA pseudouridine38-40 synthase